LLLIKSGSSVLSPVRLYLWVNSRGVLPQVGGPVTLFVPTTTNSAGEAIACAAVGTDGTAVCQGTTTGDVSTGGVAVVCFLGANGSQVCDPFGPFQPGYHLPDNPIVPPLPPPPAFPPPPPPLPLPPPPPPGGLFPPPPPPGPPGPPGPVPATPTPPPGPAPVAPALPNVAPGRFFPSTGFGIHNDAFWEYFNARGGVSTFGFPISREFQFLGRPTQFFQRQIMQVAPDGGVQTMNLLDAELMPYTRINGSVFPAEDAGLKDQTPSVGSPNYATAIGQFIEQNAPETWNGMPVRFWTTFRTTVPEDAVPPNLLTLANLEIWGVVTSPPAFDPSNQGFVYQRYQRSIMHYRQDCQCTEGLLMAEWFKTIITGDSLPPDLAAQAQGSRFYLQYNNAQPLGLNRSSALPDTDMRFAFETDRP
jgi:hypothetical protein